MAKRTLSGLSVGDLQRELRRRERGVEVLVRKRDKLMEKVHALDTEIAALGIALGSRRAAAGRRRPRNDSNLADALVSVLKTKTLSVTDVAQAVQEAGYVTTSPNFRTIVNQTLIKDKRIKRVGRGQYTAKGGSAGGGKGRKKKESAEAAAA